jgi:NADH:ubiquinone oxidoreductase subunit 6 (subunit J)
VIQVVFIAIASLGLAAALGTILARNLVRAALYLIAFFFTVACIFVILEAEFLAALQVLVYIGAVAILLMFGIMLTRNIQGDDPTTADAAWRWPGLVAGICVFVVIAYGIGNQKGIGTQFSWPTIEVRPKLGPTEGAGASQRAAAVNNMAKTVGSELMTRYVIAFEVAGLLLTAALVGAIAIAHREELEPGSPRPSRAALQERRPSLSSGVGAASPYEPVSAGAPGPH